MMISPEGKQKLKSLLIQHESCKLFPYTDTTGHLTIGVGRCLDTRGISQNEALYLLDDDIIYFTGKLNFYLPCWADLNEARQIALIDMSFNIGIQGLLNFKDMLAALNVHNYEQAAEDMLNSEWKKQVGERAFTLASIMKTGQMP